MMTHHAVLIKVFDPKTYQAPVGTTDTEIYELRQDQIGIGDVRSLIEQAHRRPSGEARFRQLLVMTSFITVEAQQAMLKVIEEPPESTQFVFVIPESLPLLGTLLSRFSIESGATQSYDKSDFKEFDKQSIKDKLAAIEASTKNKDHEWQSNIKSGLIEHLKNNSKKYSAPELSILEYIAATLLTRGASNKYLLEHLALTLETRS